MKEKYFRVKILNLEYSFTWIRASLQRPTSIDATQRHVWLYCRPKFFVAEQ